MPATEITFRKKYLHVMVSIVIYSKGKNFYANREFALIRVHTSKYNVVDAVDECCFHHEKIKFISSSHCVILLYIVRNKCEIITTLVEDIVNTMQWREMFT